MTHTPTPWKVWKDLNVMAGNRSICSIGHSDNFNPDTPEINKANAAYIVKAVNAHEALLKAAKYASEVLVRPSVGLLDYAKEQLDKAIAMVKP